MQSPWFFLRIIILLTLCVSSSSMASGTINLDLTFTATLRETTCDMTPITGTASSIQTAISNSATNNAASNVGVSIARAITPDQPFEINATDDAKSLLWTSSEISAKEVPLVARLMETETGKGTTGIFSATATFNFEYE